MAIRLERRKERSTVYIMEITVAFADVVCRLRKSSIWQGSLFSKKPFLTG
jgi:hypothetical protein